MIDRIPDQIPVQTGEWRGTTFDIIPKETFAMACRKINEVIDNINRLEESVQGVVNNSIADGGRIRSLQVQIHALKTRLGNVQPDAESRPENVQDKFAEQRKWIGCLVRYKICDWQGGWATDVLEEIVDHPIYPFKMRNGQTAQVCELVTADEIYPNKARTW